MLLLFTQRKEEDKETASQRLNKLSDLEPAPSDSKSSASTEHAPPGPSLGPPRSPPSLLSRPGASSLLVSEPDGRRVSVSEAGSGGGAAIRAVAVRSSANSGSGSGGLRLEGSAPSSRTYAPSRLSVAQEGPGGWSLTAF